MPYRKWLICSITMLALIQAASGIQVTCSGGSTTSESGSVATQIEAVKDASVLNEIAITGDGIKPFTSIRGPVGTFSQTHQVTDKSGKTAKVTVNVVNALRGLDYKSEVLPQEGTLTTIEPQVSAEQWLTVPRADSIRCLATASYKTLSADAGIEEISTRSTGHYATLTGYDCKATASSADVTAYQTAASGTGGSIKIYGHAKDNSGTFGVETQLPLTSNLVPFTSNLGAGFMDQDVSFKDLNAMSSAGTSTGVTQNEHVVGKFISSAKAGTKTTSRISNYGNQYDLIMIAAKGSQPTGALGYYINPCMVNGATGAIQGAVNAAKPGDIINAAAGEYNEDVNINKAITLKGSGDPTANSFTLNSVLGTDSGGITASLINVMSGAKIQDGVTLASTGGRVNVAAGKYAEDVNINKPLTLKGDGAGSTIATSFELTNGATLGEGSVGITAPLAIVNPYSKIADGLLLSSQDIHVYGDGGSYVYGDQLDQSALGSSIILKGFNNALTDSISINQPVAGKICGIKANTVNVNSGGSINDGLDLASYAGTVNVGAGNYLDNVNQDFYSRNIQLSGMAGSTITNQIDLNQLVNGKISDIMANTVNVNPTASIVEGIDLANTGVTVNVKGTTGYTYNDDLTQSFYGKGVTLTGTNNPVTNSIMLDQGVAGRINGITANTVNILNNGAKIQDGISLASTGGTVNVGAGTYNEDININKGLTLKGIGDPIANSFTLNAILGTGSGGITASIVDVNPNSRITDGIALSSKDVFVNGIPGYTYSDDLTQAFYTKGILLTGINDPVINSISLNQPISGKISGINANIINILDSGAKIHEGIYLVARNGTINIAPGTYEENIGVNKPLTLTGAGRDNTVITRVMDINAIGTSFTDRATIKNIQLTSGMTIESSHISLEDITFTNAGLFMSSGTDMNANGITIYSNSGYGVALETIGGSISNVSLKGSRIFGSGGNSFGVAIMSNSGSISNINIDDAQITNFGRYGIYAGASNGGSVSGLSLKNVKISQSGYGGGLVAETSTGGSISGINMVGGAISGTSSVGMRTKGSVANVVINKVNIYANSGGGVKNEGTSLINALFNWWGASNGPSGAGTGSGDSVSTNVLFNPWNTTAYT